VRVDVSDEDTPPLRDRFLKQRKGCRRVGTRACRQCDGPPATRSRGPVACAHRADEIRELLRAGVPLRDVLRLCGKMTNVRRIYYWGFHNNDPAQRFQSSLSYSQVMETPPGELPVFVAYKLNGEPLSLERGGPVRMVVPWAHGFKSIKWLQHIVLTNDYRTNDTYAEKNNDIDSKMKSFARFIHAPTEVEAGQPLAVTGVAQSGMSGLSKVQYLLQPQDQQWPEDDPYFTTANWTDAEVLPPPENWGGGLPDGKLSPVPRQFDEATGKPLEWPLRNAIAHWAALLPALSAGKYFLRCRAVDGAGNAQPMPRPFAKSGRNAIHEVSLTVAS
jgi:hypothetical protein